MTQTDLHSLNSRFPNAKDAKNKNIVVIGGSGTGKTRFFVKPNLMQMHSSYVVTDPKDGTKQRGYSGAVKLYVPHEKWESKLLEYGAIRIKKDKVTQKEYWKAIHRPKLINKRDIEILSKYNSEVRRGSTGIALLDTTGDTPKLKYMRSASPSRDTGTVAKRERPSILDRLKQTPPKTTAPQKKSKAERKER